MMQVNCDSLYVFYAFVIFFATSAAVDIESIVSQCCNEGNEWGAQRKHCNEYKFNLDKNIVPAGLHGLCLSTVEICCAKQHRIFQCTAGAVAAKSSSSCDNNSDNYGTEFFKDCCEACKIGLVIGSTNHQCSSENSLFGSPWDDIIEDCCTDIRESDTDETHSDSDEKNICQQIDNLCTQICVPTDDSYVCRCEAGYELLEDKITCVKKTNVIDNEIPQSLNKSDPLGRETDCPIGTIYDSSTQECEDINECETGEATCDINNQACLNTIGSYKCLDILTKVSNCDDGYRYQARIDQCVDINECSEGTDDCDRQTQLCLNTLGGYKCQQKVVEKCLHGLRENPVTKLCEDINECLDPDSCDENYRCVNTVGAFECIPLIKTGSTSLLPAKPPTVLKCAQGYHLVRDQCVDIDECNYDREACDTNQICTNLPGAFRCDCKVGFVLDSLTNACEDINECQINLHECLETQRCDNTIGSYRCIRTQSCGTGYTFNAETQFCDDDDECALNRHNCFEPYECFNTKGSFRCIKKTTTTSTTTTTARPANYYSKYTTERYTTPLTYCPPGFERNNLGACVDINECEVRNPCARSQKCVNTNGAYRCLNSITCQNGFELNADGSQCIDIDECATREAICGPQQTCKNKPGGYACVCPAGFVSTNNRNCEDINECEYYKDRRPCPSNADCINSIGSYHCHCKAGFKNEVNDDRKCIDVDECVEYPGLCQHRCVNYWGSYKCGCESGFKLNPNNRTCDDIDECEVHRTYRLCVGICENIPGSYRCTCPEGYRIGADTRSCEDIDECRETPGICRGDEICTNLRGSYRCIPILCPYGYMRDPDRNNRCKRISMLCDHDDYDCFRKPTSYSYNFISMVPNMTVPITGTGLFNLQTTVWSQNLEFDLKIESIHSPPGVERATDHFFSLRKVPQGVTLQLLRPLDGPQDIELELTMNVFTQDRTPSGSSVAKIFILVSEYPY